MGRGRYFIYKSRLSTIGSVPVSGKYTNDVVGWIDPLGDFPYFLYTQILQGRKPWLVDVPEKIAKITSNYIISMTRGGIMQKGAHIASLGNS